MALETMTHLMKVANLIKHPIRRVNSTLASIDRVQKLEPTTKIIGGTLCNLAAYMREMVWSGVKKTKIQRETDFGMNTAKQST